MKLFTVIFCLLLSLSAFGQKPDDVLATANGRTWTVKDLAPEARGAHLTLPAKVANVRKQLLSQMLGETLIEVEATNRNITALAVVRAEAKKVKDPTPAEIKTVYDINQDKLGGKTLEQVRSQIIEYMRHEPEEKALEKFVDTLAVKYKVVYGKDVNSPGLKPTDLLYSMTGGQLTVKEFDDANRLTLYSFEAEFYEGLKAETEAAVYDALVIEEAKVLKMDAGDLIAREVTGKMKDFTDAARDGYEAAFRTKLFAKYNAKILVTEPAAPVQSISIDDDRHAARSALQ